MSDKLEQILNLVDSYIQEKNKKEEKWEPGEDWVSYSGPTFDSGEYTAAIRTLLDEWLVFGKNARNFELEFSKELGKRLGVLTNSGSSANLLMVSALLSRDSFNIKKGDKFITPVTCFPTTLNPLLQCGLEPVFVDVDLPSLNLNLDQVEEALKKDDSIRGIIFAHVLGNPPNMDRLMQIVKKHDLLFLEDACDALGSTYDGKKLGSFGEMSTCSFYPAHHMTMGEGGFVATNSGKLRNILSSIRDWGRACYCNTAKPGDVTQGTACGFRFNNWLPGIPEAVYDHRYVYDQIGYNLKPLDLQASIGLQQLKKLERLHEARKINFKKLSEVFGPYSKYFYLPKATEKSDPSWFAYLLTVRDDSPFKKQDFVNHLEDAKIQTRSYFSGNILYHPGYQHLAKKYDNIKREFPNADRATRNSFFLGTYIGITEEKIDYIKNVVDRFFVNL
tara:strand:+ start:1215 stop:2552 length:1338 start_codon:yes stop_codon:yes gene_type:complete